jgi:hypothetical protein
MPRNLIAVIVACVYVAGAAWLVDREGRSYREGLKPVEPVTASSDDVPEPSSTSVAEPKKKLATTKAKTKRRRDPGALASRSKTAVTPTAQPVHAETPSESTSPPAGAPNVAHNAAATNKSAGEAAKSKTAPADPLAGDPYWGRPPLSDAWDLTYFRHEDERRMGDLLHQIIVRFNPLVADPGPWLDRVEEAAKPLLKNRRRNDVEYEYFILDSDNVNAFSTPGGRIYISRGLFDLVGEDEDYALQFAIGHEIAHVDLEHALKCLRDKDVMKLPQGTLFKLYALILPFGYKQSDPVDQEYEADEWVANHMLAGGRSRREVLVFPQKLAGYAKNNGFQEGRAKPRPGQDLSPVENHYRAQTSIRKRLKHLKEYLDAREKK